MIFGFLLHSTVGLPTFACAQRGGRVGTGPNRLDRCLDRTGKEGIYTDSGVNGLSENLEGAMEAGYARLA